MLRHYKEMPPASAEKLRVLLLAGKDAGATT